MINILSISSLSDSIVPLNQPNLMIQSNIEYTLYILIEGLIEFKIDENLFSLKPQMLFFACPEEKYSFCIKSDDIQAYKISFSFNQNDELYDLLNEKLNEGHFRTVPVSCLRIIENIKYYTNTLSRESTLSLNHLVSSFLYLSLDENDYSMNVSNLYENYVKHSIEYMTSHIYEKVRVKDLSNKLGVCDCHYMRLFKSVVGLSPMDYFLKLKMIKATELLKTANMSLAEIADKLNFSSDAHFSRTFKKYMGCNPSIYRRQATLVKEKYTFSDILLQTIIDSSPDLIFFKDTNFILLGCNTAFSKVLGLEKSQIIGKRDADLFPYKEALFYNRIDEMILESGNAQSNLEWMTFPDGTRKHYEVMKAPFYDKAYNVAGIVGISREVSQALDLTKLAYSGIG
jgi:PAS domain S-box